MPQLLSNFELNSKLPNFTRDSFKTLEEMRNVNPAYMDEGHISYCEDEKKHFIYQTSPDGNSATWIELTQNLPTIVETLSQLDDDLAESLFPGSLVWVEETDTLYYRVQTKYMENQQEVSGWFCPIPKINEVTENYLSKAEADEKYLSITTAEGRYLQKDDAADQYATKSDVTSNYLTKAEADKKYITTVNTQGHFLSKNDAAAQYLAKNDAIDTYLTKDDAESKYLTQRVAEDEYAKKDDVRQLVDGYKTQYTDAFVGVDIAEGLRGHKGVNINSSNFSINEVLDKIIFKECTPTPTTPSIEIDFKLSSWDKNASWYDSQNKILLLKTGSTAPQQYFVGVNIKNSQFTSLSGGIFNHTNGINTNEQNAPNSKIVCKVQRGDKWETLANLPSKFDTPGDYRYYYDARFKAGEVVLNNKNEEKIHWDVNTPIESSNFITINVSKPTKKNTSSGLVENPILYWKGEMEDYFTLSATCMVEQKFQTPREAKKIYVWNDLCGYAEDLSFTKAQKSDGYYEYTYDHANKGHRGGIKIKVVF